MPEKYILQSPLQYHDRNYHGPLNAFNLNTIFITSVLWSEPYRYVFTREMCI